MRNRTLFATVVLALSHASLADAQTAPSITQCVNLVNQEKLAEAEPFCKQAATDSPREGKLIYGDFLYRQDDPKGAIRQYTELLEGADLNQPSAVEVDAMGHRAMAKFKRGINAGDDVERYLKHRPNDEDMLRFAFQATSLSDKREEFASRLLALKPREMEYHVFRIQALIRGDKTKEAVAAADEALKLDPKSNYALTWRGFAYFEQGDFAEAERDHAAVVKRLPKEPDPHVNRAKALVGLKRYTDAIDSASRALELKADHLEGLMVRAQARLQMGDGEGALADIEAAKTAAPTPFESDVEYFAREVIATHAALSRESVERMEADRRTVFAGLQTHLHGKCGYYRVPDYEDNDNLNAYWNCIKDWSSDRDDEDLSRALQATVIDAADRLYEGSRRLEMADLLRCSKMPRKSRCVDDSLYSRATAASADLESPKLFVREAERNRLNQEVAVYNARLKRQESLSNTAGFLQAVADALSEQNQQ